MSAFVNLSLKILGKDEVFTFDDIVDSANVTILLGAPGCGKSTLLKHFADQKSSVAKYLRIQQFLNVEEKFSNIEYILLDGFDELKSRNGDSSEYIYKIAVKINHVHEICPNVKFVLSCREIDWYGDDTTALQEDCNVGTVSIFYIQPLDYRQKFQLVEQLIDDEHCRNEFWQLSNSYDIIDNPQILTMFVDAYLTNPQNILRTKRDVYERFVRSAKEQNRVHKNSIDYALSEDEIFRYGGYLAYCSLFSGNNDLNDDFLENVADTNLYPLSKLKLITESKLFRDSRELCFAHRTIAEFLCAHFLFHEKCQKDLFPLKRVAGLLLAKSGKKVLAEYRGVYAWLCSFSQDEELIGCDPYGQFLYGDNSIYSTEMKVMVLSAIRSYAEKNPYFMHHGRIFNLDSFYDQNLDSFLVKEYRECWNKPNHYLFLLGDLIGCSKNPDEEIKLLAVDVLRKEKLETYFKKQFIPLLRNAIGTLKKLLQEIESGKIEDKKNDLLDSVLFELYPSEITPSELVDHLKKYKANKELFSHYRYLDKEIPYVERKLLVQDLYDNFSYGLHHDSSFYYEAKHFVNQFFEIALKNESPRNFLEILLCFNEKELSFTESSWTETERLFASVNEYARISLYEEYLKLIVPKSDEEERSCWVTECNLRYYIDCILPKNNLDILQSKMISSLPEISNLTLLRHIYSGMRSRKELAENAKDKCSKLALKYDIDGLWKNYIAESPEMRKLREQQEKRERERQKRIQKSIEENEAEFKKLTIEERKNAWNYFFHVASYFLRREAFEENAVALHENTYNEILYLIKEKIFVLDESQFKDELLLETLVEKHLGSHTNFTEFVCASLLLNNENMYEEIAQKSYADYLYITALSYKGIVNFKKIGYLEWFEKSHNGTAFDILWKFVDSILKKGLSDKYAEVKSILENLFKQIPEENRLKRIQELYLYRLNTDVEKSCKNIIDQIVEQFAFEISPLDYDGLIGFSESTDSKITLLKKFNESMYPSFDFNESIALFELLKPNHDLSSLNSDGRFRVAYIFLNSFNSDELLDHPSGFQTKRDNCAWFVDHSLFNQMDDDIWLDVVNRLLIEHQDDYWTNRLKNKQFELQEKLYGEENPVFSLEKVKSFVFNKGYTSSKDFWLDLVDKIDFIKNDIEHNQINQKRIFWGKNNDPKIENDCRDIILVRLNDLYKSVLNATREVYVANDKRVDINIKCRQDESFVTQVECKRDDNAELFDGIKKQLIEQYLYKNVVEYGIYLVFCFKKDPKVLEGMLIDKIPQGFEEKIKIICIDLRK